LKAARFAHRVFVTCGGNIVHQVHAERARRLLASGLAQLLPHYSGLVNEIVLTQRFFAVPLKPKSWLNKRNLYSSPSSQDTNVARGTLRSLWVQAQKLHG